MSDYGRRVVVDADFETTLNEVERALGHEGLRIIARLDLRDETRRHATHDFHRFELIDVWSPDLALKALRDDMDVGTILTSRFTVYELGDGETVVAATEPLLSLADDFSWREELPLLPATAEREGGRVARVLEHLLRFADETTHATPAA